MPFTIGAAMATARQTLPGLEARILLQHVTGLPHAALAAHPERLLDQDNARVFLQLVERRARGEPVAYLTGSAEFYGRRFSVGPEVLIPRPETELLVDLALERLPLDTVQKVADLGTGSGVIGLTLALERPRAVVTLVDESLRALAMARRNAADLGAQAWIQPGDWLSNLAGVRFDLVVSNPPYIAGTDPHLQQGDLRFEPRSALTPEGDGLSAIRRIVTDSPGHLEPGGWLLFEHGYDQGPACRQLLAQAGFREVASWPDLAGIERVSGGRAPAD